MSMVRAAIIGLGRWGKSLVNSVHGKTDAIQFVAGHSRTRAGAEDFLKEKNIPFVDSYDAILANKSIDAVVLATPHSQHAEQVGAASIMVVPPYYDPLSFREIKAYYTAVAESVNIPIMLYHIPSVTGQNLTPDQIGELAVIGHALLLHHMRPVGAPDQPLRRRLNQLMPVTYFFLG